MTFPTQAEREELAENIWQQLENESYLGTDEWAAWYPDGCDLYNVVHLSTLHKALKGLKEISRQYDCSHSSVPAGGFSGANSATMRSSRSGTAISYDVNGSHHGGQYGFTRTYALQIRVGGGIDYGIHCALLAVAKRLLSFFYYESDTMGKTRITETNGTNWSSIMMIAPSKDNKYMPFPLKQSIL